MLFEMTVVAGSLVLSLFDLDRLLRVDLVAEQPPPSCIDEVLEELDVLDDSIWAWDWS